MRKSRVSNYGFFLLVISSMLCFCAAAQQNFRYKATLDNVVQNGFYTIHLSPAIVAECQPQLEDIRIKDNAGSHAPYIIRQQTGAFSTINTLNDSDKIIPLPKIVQHDSSDKKSYIRLQFDNKYRIDKLQFSLKGAKFFNRLFTLYNNNGNSINSTVLATGYATSGDSSIMLNLQVKTNTLLLVISNLDNAPLTLSQAAAYQLPVDLVAYLDSGKNYNLHFGDSDLKAPAYDLQYFRDSIRSNTYPLAIKKVEKIAVPAQTEANTHISGWLLWSTIIAVLLLLIYFSYALLKDINRKTTNNTDAHL
jgi:hypothetical protein